MADYRKINPDFGTMEDLELLIKESRKRGMGLMLDMVFNHTSTEHECFRRLWQAIRNIRITICSGTEARISRPRTGSRNSAGSAWEYVPHLKQWYLHLYDVTQADLNWDNPEVREELKEILRFWKEKGIRAFDLT